VVFVGLISVSRRSFFFGLVFAIGLLVIAQMEYYPSSGMFTVMGMTGPRANQGRECFGDFFSNLMRLEVRRVEVCYGHTISIPTVLSHSEIVSVTPFTHKLMHAATSWALADSAAWQQKRDSIFRAISDLGGHPVGCATWPAQRWFANAYYVKFPDFYLKIRAEKFDRGLAIPPMPWMLSVEGYPRMPYECVNRPPD